MEQALSFLSSGLNPTEVAKSTGIPRSTVRDWSYGRHLDSPRCGAGDSCTHDLSELDPDSYRYLLGIYLGDGYMSAHPRGVWHLRITLDARYPRVIDECAAAIEAIVPGKHAHVFRRPDARCVDVSAYWKHWPCVIPQHGQGKKHHRKIRLTDEQERIVMRDPRRFLRGLIHSDGCRIVAVERKGNYERHAPRYAFTNLSEDILGLFGHACDAVGVQFTRPSYKQIAVYRKESVARLDEFIGPKS